MDYCNRKMLLGAAGMYNPKALDLCQWKCPSFLACTSHNKVYWTSWTFSYRVYWRDPSDGTEIVQLKDEKKNETYRSELEELESSAPTP